MKKLFLIVLFVIVLLNSGCLKPKPLTPGDRIKIIRESFSKLNQIEYKEEYGQDYWQTPQETRRIGAGDCEDQAIYLQKILKDEGWNSQVIFGKAYLDVNKYEKLPKDEKKMKIFLDDLVNELKVMHAWVEIQIKWTGTSIILDPTNGIFVIKSMLDKNYYVPINGIPLLLEKIEKYQDDNKVILNYHYNVLINQIKQQRKEQKEYKKLSTDEIKWLEEKTKPPKILDIDDMPPAP